MHHVRGRVRAAGAFPERAVHQRLDLIAVADLTGRHRSRVDEHIARRALGVDDLDRAGPRADHAAIANLAAALAVERGGGQHDPHLVAFGGHPGGAATQQSGERGLGLQRVVAQELGRSHTGDHLRERFFGV